MIPETRWHTGTNIGPQAAQHAMRAGGCPYSYRSSGDYCVPSKDSKDAFIRTGNSCPNGYRKTGKYCIAN